MYAPLSTFVQLIVFPSALWMQVFLPAFKCCHSEQNKLFFWSIMNPLIQHSSLEQHQKSLPLRTMCYIINKKNVIHRRIAQKTLLSSQVWIMFCIQCLHTASTIMSNLPWWRKTVTITMYLFADVCMCVRNIKRMPINVFLCVFFAIDAESRKCNFSLLLPIHYWLPFHFRQGCKWLKALDISVKLRWFRNRPNFKWCSVRLTAPDWISR